MRAGAHARTVFAGFGVSGSLLAAVGGAFLVAGGVMAFDQWPAGLSAAPEKSLAVASIPGAPPVVAPARVALPAAAAAPGAAARPGTAGPSRRAAVPGRQANTTGGTAATPGAPAAPPGTPAPVAVAGPVPAPVAAPPGLATSVEATTSATADAVRGLGTRLPGTAPVTDLVGGIVDDAGNAVGGLLRGLGTGR